jgi:hypothetical protein
VSKKVHFCDFWDRKIFSLKMTHIKKISYTDSVPTNFFAESEQQNMRNFAKLKPIFGLNTQTLHIYSNRIWILGILLMQDRIKINFKITADSCFSYKIPLCKISYQFWTLLHELTPSGIESNSY